MKKNMAPTNADNVGKIHFCKVGKYVDITQRHETFLICLKTNWQRLWGSSNATEQMIYPLKQTEGRYLFCSQEGMCSKGAAVGFSSYSWKS